MEELTAIIKKMDEVFDGNPWYGKAVLKVLKEMDPSTVYVKPNTKTHSAIDLIYHMINWQEFTLHQLEGNIPDPARYESLDWRTINPVIHTWSAGIESYVSIHNRIINILKKSAADLLNRKAQHRDYNIRVLLYGLIDHNIYHCGQLAFLKKTLLSLGV
jgi:uncharacterized damage-inducible protein DinB